MKRIRLLILVVGFLLGLVAYTYAHEGNRLYPIIELTDAALAEIDLEDGSIEDWRSAVGEPTLVAGLDFATRAGYGSYDPADFDFRIWCAWHEASNRIYIAMAQVDDAYVNEYVRGGNWLLEAFDSSMSFMVDGDHSGGQFLYQPDDFDSREEWRLAALGQAQWYMVLGDTHDDGLQIGTIYNNLPPELSEYPEWFLFPPYADAGGGVLGEQPTFSFVEFYITPFDRFVWDDPQQSEVSELYRGKVIGLSITIFDWDSLGEIKSQHILPESFGTPSLQEGADLFADFILVGPEGEVAGVSAVESISWGDIKTTLGSE